MIEHLKDLMSYHEWADAVFLNAWQKTSAAVEDLEMLKRWEHVNQVQKAFHDVLRMTDSNLPKSEASPPSFSELKEQNQKNHDQLKTFVTHISESDLERTLEVRWFPDHPAVVTSVEAIMQVLLHTQHHRAQNMTRLQTLGGRPVVIDWISWIWRGKPEAKWK